MDDRTADQIIIAASKIYGVDLEEHFNEKKQLDFSRHLFKQQRDFVFSTARRKLGLCARRSGKSWAAAYYLIKTAYEKTCNVAYFALSRNSARRILWDQLIEILDAHGIKYSTNSNDLTIKIGKSYIYMYGATNDREIDKQRGMHYDLVILDECGATQYHSLIENLLFSVLAPTLFQNKGTMCLISNPGVICDGFFYKASNGLVPGWEVHKWNTLDNPFLPIWSDLPDWKEQAPKLVLEEIKSEGLDENSPIYIREWLGKWYHDSSSSVYKFDNKINTFDHELNTKIKWNYIFGMDFGMVDASVIVVGAWSPDDTNFYIVDLFVTEDLSPGKFSAVAKGFFDKYQPVAIEADANGMGLAFISEIQSKYQIPINKAEKSDKIGFIELMNDDFKQGKILIKNNLYPLIEELASLQWKNSGLKILYDNKPDHCTDALLYAWRKSKHYTGKIPKKAPKYGTKEFEDALYEQEMAELEGVAGQSWWERGYQKIYGR